MSIDLEALVAEVCSSTRYRAISPGLVSGVVQAELRKQRSHKETVKAVRTKLHQMVGVFWESRLDSVAALATLREAATDPAAFRAGCRAVMLGHASTRERLPILEQFYGTIFRHLGPVQSVLDLGCGLNPLAIPWMPLADACSYHAYDVHSDLVDFLTAAVPLTGVAGGAHLTDLTHTTVDRPADLALLLKCLPSLDQLDRLAGARLLTALRVKQMVVSFPLHSLSGRERGMRAHYAGRFQAILADHSWHVVPLEFPTELVYIVTMSNNPVW